ncbi:MAG: DNA replication/repair protein RecF [Bacteroidota bacterium]
MRLNKLSVINFKNLANEEFTFNEKVNCIVGKNGKGKTNVLDSIYVLAFGKSYFNPVTSQNIKHQEEFFVVDGDFEEDSKRTSIIVSVKKGQKKVIKKNAKVYDKISDHIGSIPLVIISPSDRDLIIEGSATRRKFVDSVISQNNKNYLNWLISYNKILSQRNALLKYFAANASFNKNSVEVYNDQLIQFGEKIHQTRIEFINQYKPILQKRYQEISNNDESIDFKYKSQLESSSFQDLLTENLNSDLRKQYTTQGIHKDDFIFKLNNYPIKKFGSQGQQKSFLVALKFAQYDFLKALKGNSPILLLDDVFDKLDEERVQKIIKMVTTDELGQLFISDTHKDRTEKVVQKNTDNYKIIEL